MVAAGPRWSPNGEQLAYLHLDAAGELAVHILRRPDLAEAVVPVSRDDRAAQIAWSPDSEVLAVAGLTTTLLDASGEGIHRVTLPVAPEDFAAAGAAWSPDSWRLAVSVGISIWIIERDGSYAELEGAPADAGPLGVAAWLSDLELLTLRLRSGGPPLAARLGPGGTTWRYVSDAEIEEAFADFSGTPEQTEALEEQLPEANGTVLGPTADGAGRTYEMRDRQNGAQVLAVFADRESSDLLATFDADTALAGAIGPVSSVVVVR